MNTIPFILCLSAGISTLLGYLFIFIKKDRDRIISYSLSFASGVMVCVSIFDLIPESIKLISIHLPKNVTFLYLLISSIIGCLIPLTLNKIIKNKGSQLYRVGVLSMIAIIIHNIPEGIITYMSASANIKIGITMAVAIALHNIPEGVSIAIPIFYSSKSRGRAFFYTLMSGLSEPFGAVISMFLFKDIFNDFIIGITLSATAAVMLTIAVTDLIPTSLKYKKTKNTVLFFILGFIIMCLSIKLMN